MAWVSAREARDAGAIDVGAALLRGARLRAVLDFVGAAHGGAGAVGWLYSDGSGSLLPAQGAADRATLDSLEVGQRAAASSNGCEAHGVIHGPPGCPSSDKWAHATWIGKGKGK